MMISYFDISISKSLAKEDGLETSLVEASITLVMHQKASESFKKFLNKESSQTISLCHLTHINLHTVKFSLHKYNQ